MILRLRSGQALVVVLLILGVVMTVALSIASRSVSEVAVSTTQQESSQALAAAEAGVEATLGGIAAPNIAGSTVNVTSQPAGTGDSLSVADLLAAGQVATVFLNGYTGNSLKVCWGQARLETALYYTSGTTTKVDRNYNATGAASSGCPADGRTYAYSKTISFPAGSTPLYMRLREWGNGETKQPLAVVASGALKFPAQGTDITAVGQTGDSVRRIKVYDQTPDVPEVWESAVFSSDDLSK